MWTNDTEVKQKLHKWLPKWYIWRVLYSLRLLIYLLEESSNGHVMPMPMTYCVANITNRNLNSYDKTIFSEVKPVAHGEIKLKYVDGRLFRLSWPSTVLFYFSFIMCEVANGKLFQVVSVFCFSVLFQGCADAWNKTKNFSS